MVFENLELLTQASEGIGLLVHEATFTSADLLKLGSVTGHCDAKRVTQFANRQQLPLD